MASYRHPAVDDAINTLLASGVLTLPPSTSAISVQSSAPTPTPTAPLTPVVCSSVAQSHSNERFSCLSTVAGSTSAARMARVRRQTGERAEEIEPAIEEKDKKVLISVTFYLWEGRKDIVQLFGKYALLIFEEALGTNRY